MAGENPMEQALFAQIEERRKTDPLIGAKLGAKEVTQCLIAALKNEKGVHVESLLCALGALAGYSCQAAVRAQAKARSVSETSWLTAVETNDGNRYFFGDRLDYLLLESKHSVWSIAAAGAQQAGSADLPNVTEIVQHAATVLGTEEFGRPRIPENHGTGDSPANYARALWPKFQPLVTKFCPDPTHWPVLFALAAQETIIMSKSVLDPGLGLRIVMEAAIPVSKLDLGLAPTPEPAQPVARPAQPKTPRPQPSIDTLQAEQRRSKGWLVYALPIIIFVAWLRHTDSPTPRDESVRMPSPASYEALQATPTTPSTNEQTAESTAATIPEAEYIADDETISDSPDASPTLTRGDAGIEQLLREGKLVAATKSDYGRWLRYSANNGIQDPRALTFFNLSRMYVVKAPFTFPDGLTGAQAAAFMVPPSVPRPDGDPGHSIVLMLPLGH